jgi:hypothetical protein
MTQAYWIIVAVDQLPRALRIYVVCAGVGWSVVLPGKGDDSCLLVG